MELGKKSEKLGERKDGQILARLREYRI